MRNIESVLSWLVEEVKRRADVALRRADDADGAQDHKLGLVIIGVSVNLEDIDSARRTLNDTGIAGEIEFRCGIRTTLPDRMLPFILENVASDLKKAGRYK